MSELLILITLRHLLFRMHKNKFSVGFTGIKEINIDFVQKERRKKERKRKKEKERKKERKRDRKGESNRERMTEREREKRKQALSFAVTY